MEILFVLAVSLHAPQTADIGQAQDLFAQKTAAMPARPIQSGGTQNLALSATLLYAPRRVPAFDALQI
jgi:hypothetical protein